MSLYQGPHLPQLCLQVAFLHAQFLVSLDHLPELLLLLLTLLQLVLELVESLLQTDLLHLQQGAILEFIQREAMLLSKISDQRILDLIDFEATAEGGILPLQAS